MVFTMLKVLTACFILIVFVCVGKDIIIPWVLRQKLHKPRNLSTSRLTRVSNLANETEFKTILNPLMVERVSGTRGNIQVREYIFERLRSIPGWDVQVQEFIDIAPQPHGQIEFANIIATHNIKANRRLVLACHYDSKFYAPRRDGRVFIGATDSAVPCAMMIHLAENLNSKIKSRSKVIEELTLQLLFFDGEEAFVRWTSYDSIYGSRNLAALMAATPHIDVKSNKTEIDSIDVFVLLDLIGSSNPVFHSYFDSTKKLFERLQRLETRLHQQNLLESYSDTTKAYFDGSNYKGTIEDDHVPFYSRGVNILHLIPSPFPSVWHTINDDEAHLHYPTIMNLQRIIQAFVAEYMSLDV